MHEFFRLLADLDVVRPPEAASRDNSVQIFISRASKGESAAKHRIRQHASRPHISEWPLVVSFVHDFGSHVARCPTENPEQNSLLSMAAKPKIDQLYFSRLGVNQDIFKLDIAMSDMSCVQVLQDTEQLFDNCFHLLFRQSSVVS